MADDMTQRSKKDSGNNRNEGLEGYIESRSSSGNK